MNGNGKLQNNSRVQVAKYQTVQAGNNNKKDRSSEALKNLMFRYSTGFAMDHRGRFDFLEVLIDHRNLLTYVVTLLLVFTVKPKKPIPLTPSYNKCFAMLNINVLNISSRS